MIETPPLPPQNRLVTLLIGMAVANLVGGVLCFGITKLSEIYNGSNKELFIFPSFFLLPLLVGLIAAWLYRRLNRSLGITFLDALWVSLVWGRRRGDSSSRRRRLPGHCFPRALWTRLNRIACWSALLQAGLQQAPTEYLPAPRPPYRDRRLLQLDGTCDGHGRDSYQRHTRQGLAACVGLS